MWKTGFPRALENLEKAQKKVPCMEKSWNLKKKKINNNHGKIMEFCEII